MISSEEGLEIFRNWQTQQTLLWCLSVELSDFAHGPTVLIRVTCADPIGLVLTSDAWGEPVCLDLMDAEFEGFGRDESPFPDLPPERFVRLLSVRLADGRCFLFAEEALD
jgi:hypothetical protein